MADFRPRASAQAFGDGLAELDAVRRRRTRQRLRVGVGDDELHALQARVDHVVDGVAAAPPTPNTTMRGFSSLNWGALRFIVIVSLSKIYTRRRRLFQSLDAPSPYSFVLGISWRGPPVSGRIASMLAIHSTQDSRSFPLTIYLLASCSRPIPSPSARRGEARNIRAPRPADRRAIRRRPRKRAARGIGKTFDADRTRRRGPGRQECDARIPAAPVS